MDVQDYSLQDLADLTGNELRTVRSYVQRGIIPGPDKVGRGARYPREALERLKVFALLRDARRDLDIDSIRRLIDVLTPAAMSDLAEGRQAIAAAFPPPPDTMADKGAAYRYLMSFDASARSAPQPRPANPPSPGDTAAAPDIELPRLEQVAKALGKLVGGASSRSARGTNWLRIPLTHDIELSVRGDVSPEQLAWLHRIADSLRLLLTKGPKS